MKYNENEIREQLNQDSANVDTNQLWLDIKHHAPINKKRKWWPFLMMFLLGGLCSAGLSHVFFQSPCPSDGSIWISRLDSLTSANENLNFRLQNAISELGEQKKASIQTLAKVTNNKKTGKHQILNVIGSRHSNQFDFTDISVSKPDFSNDSIILTDQNKAPKDDTKLNNTMIMTDSLENIKAISVETVSDIGDEALHPSIIVASADKKWQYTLGLSFGKVLMTDQHSSNDGSNQPTTFTPFISYSVDLAASKKINKRLSFGTVLNYNYIVYRFNYANKVIENISFKDTTDIILESGGSVGFIEGNAGGKQIIETKGKIHGYQHRFSIIPTVNYQSINRNKWQLFHNVGLGLDIFNISRDVIQTYDDRSFVTTQGQSFTLNPYFRIGSQLDYHIANDLNASLLFQCSYRKENYYFSNYTGTRTSIFPTIGLGLTFK